MVKLGRVFKKKYEVVRFIQEGGFSDLYLGKTLLTNKKVVLKILRNKEFNSSEELDEYFCREKAFIDIQSQYSPNTMKLIDSFVDRTYPLKPKFVLVTTYISGLDFEDWYLRLLKSPPSNIYQYLVRNIFLPLADYFSYIHNHGVLHRDFSATNVIINEKKGKPSPVVIDWGPALNVDPGKIFRKPCLLDDMPEEDDQIYTPGYFPPELDKNKGLIPQSDVYTFGIIMFYAFTNGSHRKDEIKDESDYIVRPIDLNPDCPEILSQIVEKCTQYEPRDRYLSFNQIKKDLNRFLATFKSKKKNNEENTNDN